MKKRILIIVSVITILIIGFIIYRESKLPTSGYFIVDFENTDEELSEEERNALISLINYPIKSSFFIEFTKLVYTNSWLNDSSSYIVFKTNIPLHLLFAKEGSFVRGKEGSEYVVYEHICLNASDCTQYKVISRIGRNHYKWWEKHEENLYNIIE